MPFDENLKIAMRVRGISNYKLAQDLNVSQTSVANWISGNIAPHRKTRIKIAEYFGTTLEKMDGDCFTEEDVKENPPVDDERFLPLAERREALSKAGIHILLDADAKVTEEQLDDIISFIEIQQRRNGR